MKRKSNPWVALIALLLLLVLVVCACTGCATVEAAEPESPRFIAERVESPKYITITIITDTETGVQYMFVKDGYGAGLTVLEPSPDKEGNE